MCIRDSSKRGRFSLNIFHESSRGLPLPLSPCGFHWSKCLVVLLAGFLIVWPIHLHLWLPTYWICLCLVLCHSVSFLIFSGNVMFRIFLKQLLTKVCTFCVSVFVRLQFSHPYNNTDFTFKSNSRILVFVEIVLSFQTFCKLMKATLAFASLIFTSSSVPPLWSIMLLSETVYYF